MSRLPTAVPAVALALVALASPVSATAADCPKGTAAIPGGAYALEETNAPVKVEPYCLDVHEVRAGAYARCVEAGRCSAPGAGGFCNYGDAERTDHPVNCVDWEQSTAYCAWAGKRLPTEEEWEWAARGAERGTGYPWGDEEPKLQLCWNGPGNDRADRGFEGTCRVGGYPRGDSPQGVKDLAGNVWEWTSSVYDAANRVVRGGSWGTTDVGFSAAADRGRNAPSVRLFILGFRCACGRAAP